MSLHASHRSEIPPFHVMQVMKLASELVEAGEDVVHLEVGEPSTPAPLGALEAMERAVREHRFGYTPATGDPRLRARISRHYLETYGLEIDPERIVVTLGGSGACILAFLACFDAGARVGVVVPGYPCYRNMLTAFDIEVVQLRVDATCDWQLTEAALDDAAPLDGLVVASPSNPTGTMLDGSRLAAITQWCATHRTRLVVDEIYHGITYGRRASTALGHGDETIVVNSFSKYYCMTGWRVGWMVIPAYLSGAIERLAQNLFVAPSTPAQIAAEAAFACADELDANVDRYARNRSVLLEGLPELGLSRFAPSEGAFFVYADVGDITDDSQALCRTWLAETGVAVTPGIDFDPDFGHRSVRFSYAGSTESMHEALRRLGRWRRESVRRRPREDR